MSLAEEGWQSVGEYASFAVNTVTGAKVIGEFGNSIDLAVVRTDAGLDVIQDRCPHQGVAFTERGCLNDQKQLVCTWHNWVFNLPTGTDTDLPGVTLQPIKSVVAEGQLWVLPDPDIF